MAGIVLDGFDEMKHAMSFSEFRAQVGQFNQLITPGAKVVLLGRPSAFTTDAEHHYVLKGRIRKRPLLLKSRKRVKLYPRTLC